MSDKNLELIETFLLHLKEGVVSSPVLLKDEIGGDMYFTFLLKYIQDSGAGKTQLQIIDKFHAAFIIDTKPFSSTTLSKPAELGTYANNKKLYINIVVDPVDKEGDPHKVTISFYTNN